MDYKNLLGTFLTCHVCSETFRDPVSLSCYHSFCSTCLQSFWKKPNDHNCPICKRKDSKDYPDINFPLKNLADSFAGRQKTETVEGGGKIEVCSKHLLEDTKWFCKEEQSAVCNACHVPHNQSHTVVPIEKAVYNLKAELQSYLQSLQDKREKYKHVEETYSQMVQHSKKQLVSTERKIRAEFKKLHQFLREEEEARLAALREEEEKKGENVSREMKVIQSQVSSLSDSISAVEQDLQKDPVSFLTSYKDTQTTARALCSLSDPQLVSGGLIDVAKHLGNLAFRVWEKMMERVNFTPVILDPNTANHCLSLSDDLTSVRNTGEIPQLPDNPERHKYYADVLGSEGFSSGKHCWEVEVGDHPGWFIGVAKESADRNGKRSASPQNGVWYLCYFDGKYTNGTGETVTVERSPRKIRVQLDYDRGDVSFYDPQDMSHIYTYNDTFTEKVFPYLSIGKAGIAKTVVQICHADVCVKVQCCVCVR